MTSTTARATGFGKITNGITIMTAGGGVSIQRDDFARLLSLMCEGSSREQLDSMHRVVSQRRAKADPQ